jgi:hypothetical protein
MAAARAAVCQLGRAYSIKSQGNTYDNTIHDTTTAMKDRRKSADPFMTIKDLEKAYKEDIEVLSKQCYMDGQDIVIDIADEYRVPLSRCSTPEAILGWVGQLTEKTWITVPVIRRFVQLATRHHDIKIHPLPG